MRIISGKFKGKRFSPPADKWPTRPTTDFAKEALFNILNNHIDFEEIKVLELFGGTGSHSYEFISRGSKSVTYVEKFAPACNFVRKMSSELKVESELRVIQADVFKFISQHSEQYDFIFADPPFDLAGLDELPTKIIEKNLLNNDAWLVVEHGTLNNFSKHPNCFDVRTYGKVNFSFFRNIQE